ncbi:dipeptide/oligopeptide/nickel ABC transporter permease/ATP-binding protein [Streptacidiphilus cavernicola]|uniref:Dipeptide/oligopeptide/nickel ABC transporter permease/ATP-binding protein n=1 Tax=Streptacidiphilus cavernicola TaxID=3342716 RepID=A0ABV6VNE4_9ACTN
MKRISLIAGLALMAVLVVVAVVAPWVWGNAATQLTDQANLTASGRHLFGTDALGRDVFARTMVATRITLLMSVAAAALASVAGIAIGAAIWVCGPRVREIGLRVIDVMISYPAVILALVVAAVLGPGAVTSVVAIGLATCPAFARLTANLVASVAARDFVWSARLLGVSRRRLLRRHLLPNIAEPLLVLTSVSFTVALKALSGLSFLSLGVQPPGYDWGRLLATGLQGIYTNPAAALGPAAAIVLAGLAGGLVGDGLAASLDPRAARLATMKRTPKAAPVPAAASDAVSGTDPATASAAAVAEELVVFGPDGSRLVDGVSLAVADGEVVGLVGESGSGKSLTAMALARLLPEGLTAEAEQLRSAGLDLRGRPDRGRLARRIGIVYQDPAASFNPTMKVGTQLTEVLRVHGTDTGGRVPAAEARRLAAEQLDLAKVDAPERRMRQYPHELSGGMRQRAMIASALLTGPRLLIADEPTTALDVTVQAEVLELLRRANQRDGTAVLLISHDIGVIASVCSRVLVMYSGRIVEELTVADLRAGNVRHPYTRALLAATPRVFEQQDPEPPRAAEPSDAGADAAGTDDAAAAAEPAPLATIPGRPPAPALRPAGCAFAPRCALAVDRCRTEPPAFADRVACHVAAAEAAATEGADRC